MNNSQVALVTGAGRGIGRQVCLDLARRGWTVYVGARGRETALDVAELLTRRTGSGTRSRST